METVFKIQTMACVGKNSIQLNLHIKIVNYEHSLWKHKLCPIVKSELSLWYMYCIET